MPNCILTHFSRLVLTGCLLTVAFCQTGLCADSADDPSSKFVAGIYQNKAGDRLPYRLLKPAQYNPNHAYPLVLFLHGAGEMGTDNNAQLKHGVREFARGSIMAQYPCFVVAPQTAGRWVDVDWALDASKAPQEPSKWLQMALDLVGKLHGEFNIDSRRIYLTGLSMGGFGVWDAIQRHPDTFAAAAPVCGGGDETKAWRLTEMHIWAFHGGQDTVVKTQRSRNMIEAIRKANGSPKYTEYPGVGHDSWVKTYADPALYQWLFAQRLPFEVN